MFTVLLQTLNKKKKETKSGWERKRNLQHIVFTFVIIETTNETNRPKYERRAHNGRENNANATRTITHLHYFRFHWICRAGCAMPFICFASVYEFVNTFNVHALSRPVATVAIQAHLFTAQHTAHTELCNNNNACIQQIRLYYCGVWTPMWMWR